MYSRHLPENWLSWSKDLFPSRQVFFLYVLKLKHETRRWSHAEAEEGGNIFHLLDFMLRRFRAALCGCDWTLLPFYSNFNWAALRSARQRRRRLNACRVSPESNRTRADPYWGLTQHRSAPPAQQGGAAAASVVHRHRPSSRHLRWRSNCDKLCSLSIAPIPFTHWISTSEWVYCFCQDICLALVGS